MTRFLTTTALSVALGLGLATAAGAAGEKAESRDGQAAATQSQSAAGQSAQQDRMGAGTQAGASDRAATTVQPGAAGQAITQPGAADQAWYGEFSADQLIGRSVVNQNGENVGDIQDIVLDQQGNAMHAVVSVGGFLGMGEKDVAIPFENLQLGEGEAILMSEQSEGQLEQLPEYDENRFNPVERGERLGKYGTDTQ